jgi:hypothetical protein
VNDVKSLNFSVFDGIATNMVSVVSQADEERKIWELASALMAQLPDA